MFKSSLLKNDIKRDFIRPGMHWYINKSTKHLLLYRYQQCDLDTFDLRELQYQFDVCLIDPPLEEYQRRCPGLTFNWSPWRWDEIIRLNIGQVVAQRGFCFLWCGSAEGLDEGRKCLKAWGKDSILKLKRFVLK